MTDRADVETIGGFSSQPPWDDLHSMKRIAIVHEESLSEGMPAALHINARTDHNWQRWRDYVADRPEITHIAFEFATGAGRSKRMRRHADHLIPLAGPLQAPAPSCARARTNPAVDGSAFADHRPCSVLRCRPREPGTDKGYRSRSNPWISGPTSRVMPPLGPEPRRLIAIRIDPRVLAAVRREVRRRGLGYQSLINDLLAKHVERVRSA